MRNNRKLKKKNITKNIKDDQLKKHFEKFGSITDVRVIKRNEKSRRLCFIGKITINKYI